ncbi:HD domain-containing phosphohydrolase [Hahella ganghwensis]|uniref:HD domain-containing phosphohydrolase n=1 Tax=Hahella ganghwensis TaxID=286420 RepID=UPI000378392B|nr:HD domain-containing phosphohydrolase [Hahella ganghwensis]
MSPSHSDAWGGLHQHNSILGKLRYMHQILNDHMPYLTRLAVALYDSDTDYLRTYAYSSDQSSPLNHYHARLADCNSLQEVATTRRPRVIQDLAVFNNSDHVHTRNIYDAGFRASYTMPLIWDERFLGFVFFNSDQPNVFTERAMTEMDVAGHMITLMVYSEISKIRTLLATLKSALDMTHSRDPETGGHLERMSRYARLIAKNLAGSMGIDDHFVEHIFMFSPLHDLGKLTIPDRILLKAGPLDDDEFSVMKTHSEEGRKLIDRLLENYGLDGVSHVEMLRNIVLHHHESWDGHGYPDQLSEEGIPLEARIVAVADVFDALTSKRPYKEAWSNERAFEKLRELAGVKLDEACVEALLRIPEELLEIQRAFQENTYG